MADRSWIVSTVLVPPALPSILRFGVDKEAARAEYIGQITQLGAPPDKISHDASFLLTERTTLQYTDPVTSTRVVLAFART